MTTFTTYSIRLDEEERALLERVVSKLGWTPTHFVRQATLEKAAHIDNATTRIRFELDRLTRPVARRLCQEPEPTVHHEDYPEVPPEPLKDYLAGQDSKLYVVFKPDPLKSEELEELRRASLLAGAEFLKNLLDECERLVDDKRPGAPPVVLHLGDSK